jgi:transposase-like protein
MKTRKCPYCHGSGIVFRGFRHNFKSRKQLMLCKSCGKKFTPDDGFLRMRFPPAVIREAVSLYGKGFSAAEVSRHLESRDVKVSRWTVLCWVKKYGKRANLV